VAYTFLFPAKDIWAMDMENLMFWHRQAIRIQERQCD
jgi:hypothetical protein